MKETETEEEMDGERERERENGGKTERRRRVHSRSLGGFKQLENGFQQNETSAAECDVKLENIQVTHTEFIQETTSDGLRCSPQLRNWASVICY